jgi:hypothetical protein
MDVPKESARWKLSNCGKSSGTAVYSVQTHGLLKTGNSKTWKDFMRELEVETWRGGLPLHR